MRMRWLTIPGIVMAVIASGCATTPDRGLHTIPAVRDYRALPEANVEEAAQRVSEALRAGSYQHAPFEFLSATAYLETARELRMQGDHEGARDYAALAREKAEEAIRRAETPRRTSAVPQTEEAVRTQFETLRQHYEALDDPVARDAAPARYAHVVTSLSRAEHALNKPNRWREAARELATVEAALMDVEMAVREQQTPQQDPATQTGPRDRDLPALDPIHFESGSAELSPEAMGYLRGIALLLNAYPEKRVIVAGHSDGSPSEGQALELSRQRAQNVVRHLSEQLPGLRASVTFHGVSRPIADNQTATGRAANRRVELHLE